MDWRKCIVNEARKKYKPVMTQLSQLIADTVTRENALLEELSQQENDQAEKLNVEPWVWCRSLLQDLQNLESDLKKHVEQVAATIQPNTISIC